MLSVSEALVEYRPLGDTGLMISRIALGTVELGMDYGFRDSHQFRKPAEQDAIRIVHHALDLGINLIDTARSYGSSEEVIGRALRETKSKAPFIASKVTIPETLLKPGDANKLRGKIEESIESSLNALQVDALDVLQVHNGNTAILANDGVIRALEDARQKGKVRFLGASCVGEDASRKALERNIFTTLQAPFNILDQTILSRVLPSAREQGVSVITRSAFLRGVLTEHVHGVPGELSGLKEAALQLEEQFRGEVDSLSELALRFCLSFDAVSSVIIGVRRDSELESNVAVAERGPLSTAQLQKLSQISPRNPGLIDPQNWQGLI
jgi:aryl-alcohol dehydrogenase-like predicted oxidoreductase